MSLKEKCLQLKEEISQLKKKSKEPREVNTSATLTHNVSQKELRNILFPKENTSTKNIATEIKSPRVPDFGGYNTAASNFRTLSNKENIDSINLSHISLLQNRTNIKSEMTNIKKITNVPTEYISQYRERSRDRPKVSTWNVNTYESTSKKEEDDEENHEKRKKVLLISRLLKEQEDKVQKSKPNKENFADLCSKLYNQKKDRNLQKELKEMIMRKNQLF